MEADIVGKMTPIEKEDSEYLVIEEEDPEYLVIQELEGKQCIDIIASFDRHGT